MRPFGVNPYSSGQFRGLQNPHDNKFPQHTDYVLLVSLSLIESYYNLPQTPEHDDTKHPRIVSAQARHSRVRLVEHVRWGINIFEISLSRKIEHQGVDLWYLRNPSILEVDHPLPSSSDGHRAASQVDPATVVASIYHRVYPQVG